MLKERSYCGPPLYLIVLALVNVGLILSGLGYIPGFVKSVSGLQTALGGFDKLLKNGVGLISSSGTVSLTKTNGATVVVDSVTTALASASGYLTLLSRAVKDRKDAIVQPPSTLSAIQLNVLYPNFESLLTDLASTLTTSSSSLSSAIGPLDETRALLTGAVNSVPWSLIENYLYLAGMVILGVIAGLILFWSSLVCRNSLACCFFKSTTLFAVILSCLIFVLAGAFYIIGVVGSDVCYSPYKTIESAVATGEPTLSYYLNCTASTSKAGTALEDMEISTDFMKSGMTQITGGIITTLNATACDFPPCSIRNIDETEYASYFAPTTPFGADFEGVVSNLAASTSTLTLLTSDVMSCAGVKNVIDPFFTALCTNAITSAIGIARILIAAGVLLWIQLAIGVEVCCHHPGHPAAWTDEADLALRGVVSSGGSAAAHSINAGPHTGGGKHV